MRIRLAQRLVQYRIHAAVSAIAVLVFLFAVIAALLRSPLLERLDLHATHEVQETQSSLVRGGMVIASFFGNSPTLIVIAVLVAAYLFRKRLPRAGWFTLASLLGLPFDMLLKAIWDRPRPDETLVHVLMPRSGYSFPSGHAMGSTALYGFLAFLAWVHLRNSRYRRPIAFALALLPPVVSVSRIYVGAHWLSDVVGGMAAGLALVIVLALIFGKVQEKKPEAAVKLAKTSGSAAPEGT